MVLDPSLEPHCELFISQGALGLKGNEGPPGPPGPAVSTSTPTSLKPSSSSTTWRTELGGNCETLKASPILGVDSSASPKTHLTSLTISGGPLK